MAPPVLLREGGVGNLSHRIKGPSAEEVQAHSHPHLSALDGKHRLQPGQLPRGAPR